MLLDVLQCLNGFIFVFSFPTSSEWGNYDDKWMMELPTYDDKSKIRRKVHGVTLSAHLSWHQCPRDSCPLFVSSRSRTNFSWDSRAKDARAAFFTEDNGYISKKCIGPWISLYRWKCVLCGRARVDVRSLVGKFGDFVLWLSFAIARPDRANTHTHPAAWPFFFPGRQSTTLFARSHCHLSPPLHCTL